MATTNNAQASERDPLLTRHDRKKVPPLEISKSTRYGILAGIWVATFLSVCILSL